MIAIKEISRNSKTSLRMELPLSNNLCEYYCIHRHIIINFFIFEVDFQLINNEDQNLLDIHYCWVFLLFVNKLKAVNI
jgi:hypothetical protein